MGPNQCFYNDHGDSLSASVELGCTIQPPRAQIGDRLARSPWNVMWPLSGTPIYI